MSTAVVRQRTPTSAPAREAAVPQPPQRLVIQAPRFKSAVFLIEGTVPYVQQRFSQKNMQQMMAAQAAGSQAKKGQKREPKDFDAVYRGAMHTTADGWCGLPGSGLRSAMVSACRLVGFKMTVAKLTVFVVEDGLDSVDATPLVRITKGEPRRFEQALRNDNGGADIRVRPMWAPGWQAKLTMRWDEDQFSLPDVTNLLARVGMQVGIGEGRPDSRFCAGMGWGLFKIVSVTEL